jgi:hypothetical protein
MPAQCCVHEQEWSRIGCMNEMLPSMLDEVRAGTNLRLHRCWGEACKAEPDELPSPRTHTSPSGTSELHAPIPRRPSSYWHCFPGASDDAPRLLVIGVKGRLEDGAWEVSQPHLFPCLMSVGQSRRHMAPSQSTRSCRDRP